MKTICMALATMACAAAASAAIAQPASGFASGRGLVARLDANKDGGISSDEAEAARKRAFARLDRNGDGVVDEQEVDLARQAIVDRATMMEMRLSIRWRHMDKNGDGRVTADEFQTRPMMFELADRNGDGVVSDDEIDLLRALLGRGG